MPDITLSEALKEAYTAVPDNTVIYHTLELRHPAFTTPIRVVRDYQDFDARLEANAPDNPGEIVTFVRFAFEFSKPAVTSTGVPTLQIQIDNVSRLIAASIENALTSTELVTAIYREYISTDTSGPQNDPPLQMQITDVQVDVFKITATAGFTDLQNKKFPTLAYDTELFPGLVLS